MIKLAIALLMTLSIFVGYAFEVKTIDNASRFEKNAAAFLKVELGQKPELENITATLLKDLAMHEDTWSITGTMQKPVLMAGNNALMYVAARYIEEICGYKALSPQETIKVNKTFRPLSGKLAFSMRDVYTTQENDIARYMVFRGLNGNNYIPPEYNGKRRFGPPYNCHTFEMYIPASKYFKMHPEWFSEVDGKRISLSGQTNGAQLCLSNRELRKEMIKRLRDFVAAGRKQAEENGFEEPYIFDISQNDNQCFCHCKDCNEFVTKYGNTQCGLNLDFVNEIATAAAKEFPSIMISTFAYQYTEKVPENIRPRDNVLVVLCDTSSNVLVPLTDNDNTYFHDLLKDWSKIAKNIRIWDYNITYGSCNEMPYNSEDSYQADMQLLHHYKVNQIFTEFEEPAISDCRDYKLYLKTSLLADTEADVNALKKEFTSTFYGPAANIFLQYRERLKKSQQARKTYLGMYPSINSFTHLDLSTITAAQELFDQGATLLKNDPSLLKRWDSARLSLDRATLIRSRNLMAEYMKEHGSLEGFPFNRQDIGNRILLVAERDAKRRINEQSLEKFLSKIREEVSRFMGDIDPRSLITPAQFKNEPIYNLYDHTMDNASFFRNIVKLVVDPTSETGKVACLAFPNEHKETVLEKYQFPILFGIYSPSIKKTIWSRNLQLDEVKSPDYHWYKLGETVLTGDCYMFFFWSWYIQEGISDAFDMNNPNQKFEIWMRMKFTGPAYPHGGKNELNAIWVERLMLVKIK
ncbi:MAG: DUF4838 domain-containing protein [Lentisphaeria bacterium]